MKIKSLLSLLLLSTFLTACQSRPEFINHPKPDLTVNFEPFETAGCLDSGYGYYTCESGSPLKDLGCDEIRPPADLLGGLSPSYPLAVCVINYFNPDGTISDLAPELEAGEHIYVNGGLVPVYIRYVTIQNGEFVLIRHFEEFQKTYAPIETADEALSYVLALRRLFAYYDLSNDSALKYEVETIEDTYVTPDGDGYFLHLYDYEFFGCGPHMTNAVDIRVSKEGLTEEISRTAVFRNPEEDGLCVD